MNYIKDFEVSTKHNFVIFGSNDSYYPFAYFDIQKVNNAKIVFSHVDSDNKFLNFLCRVHTSPRVNKHITLPFQGIWNRFCFKNTFRNEKAFIFLFFARNHFCNTGTIRYLKKKYPGSKFAVFWQDLYAKTPLRDFDSLRNEVDLLLSFDMNDAKKYNMVYYPLVYSTFDYNPTVNEQYDVYFVGKAKDRVEQINDAYLKLTGVGLKCDFNVVGKCPINKRIEGINYIKEMDYSDNVKRIQNSKTILEIMQKGGSGYTLRYCESIAFGKKLITDNINIKKSPVYSKDRFYLLNEDNDLAAFVTNAFPVDGIGYAHQLSPLHLLDFIEKGTEKL